MLSLATHQHLKLHPYFWYLIL